MLKGLVVIFLFFLLSCFSAKAVIPVDSILNPKTTGTGYVSDAKHILKSGTLDKVNEILKKLDTGKRAQVAIVLVNTIGDQVPKEFATALFRYWKLGYKGINNGLLVLIVKDQRRIEFEVGYGLEGVIPDIISNHIQQQVMVPNLKNGDYDAAVLEGVKVIANTLTENNGVSKASSDDGYSDGYRLIISWLICILYVIFTFMYVISDNRSKLKGSFVPVIISIILGPVFFLILLAVLTPIEINFIIVMLVIYFSWAIFYGFYFKNIKVLDHREENYTSRQLQYAQLSIEMKGLKTYTILFPFPILIFFYKRIQKQLKDLRYSPYQCGQCKQDMKIVTANKESFLSDGEQYAEKIGAVTYDVWRCEKDNITLKIDFINEKSKFHECLKCKNITASRKVGSVEKHADYNHSGIGYDHYSCGYCKGEFDIKFIIPQLVMSTSTSSSRDDSGSDSSSSSSSDSWGGGSSGGGGSGSNW